jgi:hypothetical protein
MSIRLIRTGMMAYMGLTEAIARETATPAPTNYTIPEERPYANIASTHGLRRACYKHQPVEVTYIYRPHNRALRAHFSYISPIKV